MALVRENAQAATLGKPISAGRWVKNVVRSPLSCVWPMHCGYDVLRVLVAVVLLTAAGLKTHQLATEPVIGTGLLESRWLLMATVEFELFFGLWLLANILPKPTWAAALVCFGLFTCVSLYKALSGHATCGCFGRVPVNPWYTATLDLAVVASLLRWRPKGRHPLFAIPFRGLAVRAIVVLAIWLSVSVPAAFAIRSYAATALSELDEIIDDGRLVVLDPENWRGKRLPLLNYVDIGERLMKGKWLVLLYHHDCPKCQEAIQDLPQDCRKTGKCQVAVIEMPPYADSTKALKPEEMDVVCGRLDNAIEWFAQTPIFLTLDDGQVPGR